MIQFIRLGFFRLAVITLLKIRKRKRLNRKLPQLFLEKIKKPVETPLNDTHYYPIDPDLLRKEPLEI